MAIHETFSGNNGELAQRIIQLLSGAGAGANYCVQVARTGSAAYSLTVWGIASTNDTAATLANTINTAFSDANPASTVTVWKDQIGQYHLEAWH